MSEPTMSCEVTGEAPPDWLFVGVLPADAPPPDPPLEIEVLEVLKNRTRLGWKSSRKV